MKEPRFFIGPSSDSTPPVRVTRPPIQKWQTVQQFQYETQENPKFSILELMLITGICAAGISAVSAFGVLGALGVFVVSIVATMLIRNAFQRPEKLRFWNQFIWGIYMPLVCIFGDPFIFGAFDKGQSAYFQTYAFGCYALIGFAMMLMIGSWAVRPSRYKLNEFMAGGMLAAAIFAWGLAVILVPISVIGLIILVGVMGVTPWLTGIVYYRTAMMLLRRSEQARHGQVKLGFVAAGIIATIMFTLLVLFLSAPVVQFHNNNAAPLSPVFVPGGQI